MFLLKIYSHCYFICKIAIFTYFFIVIVMNWNKQALLPHQKYKKLSPSSNLPKKSLNSRPKFKTQNSPKSLNKQPIKNTIKKMVYQSQVNYSNPYKSSRIHISVREEPSKSEKVENKLEIVIPDIENGITPKDLHQSTKIGDRQVKSTKAGDKKILASSGRYDLKQLFKQKKQTENYNQTIKRAGTVNESFKIRQSEIRRLRNSKEQTFKLIKEENLKNLRQEQFDPRSCLTPQQYQKFGDRFPEKFKRITLLGRGGFSVVWLGVHRTTKRKFAIKQVLTKNPHQTHLKQIWFGSYFFQKGGQIREEFQDHIGINNLCRLYSYEITSLDSWLYYQILEDSLGACLFELKADTKQSEKCYKIHYKQYIKRMRYDLNQLKCVIIQIAKALHLMNSHNIVHSDLKTENILLRTKKSHHGLQSSYLKQLKLIDFGSSFLFTNLKQFSMATPQYMPPEILNYILFQNKLDYDVQMLKKMQKYKNPWVIDIWSLGCIILQIISGVPLWMSLPTRIQITNQVVTGLFAVKGRVFNKIIDKQIQVVTNLSKHLVKDNNSGITVDKMMVDVLGKMLSLNPDQRISPLQVLIHFGVACLPQKIPFY